MDRFLVNILLICMGLVIPQNIKAQYALYVGEREFLETPDPGGNRWIEFANWSRDSHIAIEESSDAGAVIYPTHYFEGTETVKCSYGVGYYIGDRIYASTGSTTFYITCNPIPFSLNETQLELEIGKRLTLKVSCPSSYTGWTYNLKYDQWESSNEDVALVSKTGVVTAIKTGTATISLDPIAGPVVYCNVTVKQAPPPESISIPELLNVYVGESEYIDVVVKPTDAKAECTLSIDSGSSDIINISGTKVTGVSPGVVNVIATTPEGLKSNVCKVIVANRQPESIVISEKEIIMQTGDKHQIDYSFAPTNASSKISWTVLSGNKYVSVSSTGIISAKKPGRAIIQGTAENGVKNQCSVTVYSRPDKILLPEEIKIRFGFSKRIIYQIQPENSYPALIWQSSNPLVATVDANGLITAVNIGKTTITATTANNITSSCTVEVLEPIYSLILLLKDLTAVTLPLEEKPNLSYNNTELIVKSNKMDLSFKIADIDKYIVSDISDDISNNESTLVETIHSHGKKFEWNISDKTLLINGLPVGDSVVLYNETGQIVMSCKSNSDGFLEIPLNNLSHGVYVVSNSKYSFKIFIK